MPIKEMIALITLAVAFCILLEQPLDKRNNEAPAHPDHQHAGSQYLQQHAAGAWIQAKRTGVTQTGIQAEKEI